MSYAPHPLYETTRATTWAGTLTVSALTPLFAWHLALSVHAEEIPTTATPATVPPLSSVRLLDSPFADAVKANRTYLLALEPDRLLAPYFREGGLEPKARPYGNWESSGLDGHTAGHYLSALATMIASGADTPEGELRRRLDYMIAELARCQKASGDGYVGGVPGSRELWKAIAAGRVEVINRKWVPWYNLHKTFAGLRDAYWFTGSQQARQVLVRCGNWCEAVTAGLSDEQMQRMLGQEHGGMNEVLADIYAITGDAWIAILRGPIVLASPSGTNNLVGLFANDGRMGHVASGPLVPMDRVPVLLVSASDLPRHIKQDTASGPMHFRLADVVEPSVSDGLPLIPFFRLHGQRYQMYWQLTTKERPAPGWARRPEAPKHAPQLFPLLGERVRVGSG